MPNRTTRFTLALIVLALVGASSPPANAEGFAVGMRDSYFTRPYLKIVVGDEVTWTNGGDTGHTVTSFNGAFDSSPKTQGTCEAGLLTSPDCIDPGDSFSQGFSKKGTFDYYCKIHGNTSVEPDPTAGAEQPCGMCGRVEVVRKAKPTIAPTRTVNPTPTRKPSPSASPSKSASPKTSATADPNATPGASSGSGKGSGRALLALTAIVALGGAGFGVWRRYLAPR